MHWIMSQLRATAPSEDVVTDYDRIHLALYAAVLDAEVAGVHWSDAARSIMGIAASEANAKACWRSHIDRARWITSAGLASALEAFVNGGSQPDPNQ
jgi:hypothetical protein